MLTALSVQRLRALPRNAFDLEALHREMQEEGFGLFAVAQHLTSELQGYDLSQPGGPSLEFDVRHGLGTFEDVQGWSIATGVELYPLGTWSQFTLFIGSDRELYLTDFAVMVRAPGGIVDAIEHLLLSGTVSSSEVIPPAL